MNLRGIHDGEHQSERVELIFFPTGGGKTEAYLGVIAFCLVLRRLRRAKLADGGLGVTVLLRYTLRLLTLNQLGRAATLICALESRRRRTPAELGDTRFSVGLWVGRSATANTMEDASKQVTGFKTGVNGNPCPLPVCPWCRAELGPNSLTLLPSRTAPDEVRVGCTSETCEFSRANSDKGDSGALRRRAGLSGAAELPHRHGRQARDDALARRGRDALRQGERARRAAPTGPRTASPRGRRGACRGGSSPPT